MTEPAITPPALITSHEKLWVTISHLSVLVGLGIVRPLIVYLVKKDESEVIRYHAKEALNFQLSLLLYSLGSMLLVFILIGVPMLIILGVAALVLSIVAAIRGSEGRNYRYPLTIRFVS